jgi:hydrogenase-4 membrane subunit HyfE
MLDAMHLLHVVLALVGMFVIICRLNAMSSATHYVVRMQHGVLFAGLLWSMVVPWDVAAAPVCGGVVGFLLLSARRWRHGAPEGTTKPADLDEQSLRHVTGGKRP